MILIQGSILDRNDDEYFVYIFIEVTIYIGQYVYKVTVKKKKANDSVYTYFTLCANMEHLLKTLVMSTCITDVVDGNMRSP